MKKPLILILLCLICTTVMAQKNPPSLTQDQIRCYSTDYEAELKQKNPDRLNTEEFEQWLAPKVEEAARQRAELESRGIAPPIRYIPTIFHIITDGGAATNISAATVQAQLDQLNEDFRRLNSDVGNTPAAFAGVAVDSEIEFCLATVDACGRCLDEPGIIRWTDFGAGPFTTGTIDATIKPATSQDADFFANMWIADISGGILGYAQFPSNSGLDGLNANGGDKCTDGVVMLTSSIGSIANPAPSPPYNLGRTGTHEVGHWLGLRHIWGDGACADDDFCGDTPNAGGANYTGAPCTFPGPNTCGSDDMFQNYMDYSDDVCMNLFTADQRARMDAVLLNSPFRPYSDAGIPTVCQPVANPPAALFEVGTGTTTAGATDYCNSVCPTEDANSITICRDLVNTITAMDLSTCGATSWTWTATGSAEGSSTAQNPTFTYNTDGTYDLVLEACNAQGCDTYTAVGAVVVVSGANCPTDCAFTLNLTDDFGDGWNGATVEIFENGVSVGVFGGGFTGGSTDGPYTVNLEDGATIDVVQTSGGFPGEEGFTLVDPFGNTVAELVDGAPTNQSFTASCALPTCTDGIQNQDETGIDCGGATCDPCPLCPVGTDVVFDENFDGCAQPAGWTTTHTDAAGNTLGTCTDGTSGFSFDCTGGYPDSATGGPNAGFAGCQAVFNDDNLGSGVVGIGCIVSPVIDLSACTSLTLSFDWQNEDASGGDLIVELDGNQIFSTTGDGNGSESIALTGGTATSQLSFCYDDEGAFAWGFAIDNIIICGECTTTACPTYAPPVLVGSGACGDVVEPMGTLTPSTATNVTYNWTISGSATTTITNTTAAMPTITLQNNTCADETVDVDLTVTCTDDNSTIYTGTVGSIVVAACTIMQACDDNDACTNGEMEEIAGNGAGAVCVACGGGTPITCDDNDPCTMDACDPVTGCIFTLIDADMDGVPCGTDCDDNDPSIGGPGSACTDGNGNTGTLDGNCVCVTTPIMGCTDPCYTEYNPNANMDDGSCATPDCNSVTCTTTQSCDDGDPCTTGEMETIFTADNSICVACGGGTPADADMDGVPCATDCDDNDPNIGAPGSACTDANGAAGTLDANCSCVVSGGAGCPAGTTTILDENFDGCTQPADWTTTHTDAAGNTLGTCTDGTSGFSFDCTGGYPDSSTGGPNAGFSGCQAVFNDDNIGSSIVGIGCLVSPVLDLSGCTNVTLSFDWQNEDAGGGDLIVELDGNQIFSTSGDGNGSESITLTGGTATSQISFCYDDEGSWAWGFALDNILVCGDCAPPPTCPTVYNVDCNDQISSGTSSLFSYNVREFCISGGTPPYTYEWSTAGYVRHAILYNDGTGLKGRVIYDDNASWAVTIYDANGCTDANWEFSNNVIGGGGTNEVVDVDSADITGDNCLTLGLGAYEGAITVTATGGSTGSYTYDWSGPFTWDGTGQGTNSISNCPSGWYSVTVTDTGTGGTGANVGMGDQAIEWFWVPCERGGGRGKIANNNLVIFPQPVSDMGQIEFGTAVGGNTEVQLFSLDGKQIATIFSGQLEAGEWRVINFDASVLDNGLYLLQMTDASGNVTTKKMTVVK